MKLCNQHDLASLHSLIMLDTHLSAAPPQLLDVNPYMAAMSESFHLLSGQMPQSMTNFAIQLLDI